MQLRDGVPLMPPPSPPPPSHSPMLEHSALFFTENTDEDDDDEREEESGADCDDFDNDEANDVDESYNFEDEITIESRQEELVDLFTSPAAAAAPPAAAVAQKNSLSSGLQAESLQTSIKIPPPPAFAPAANVNFLEIDETQGKSTETLKKERERDAILSNYLEKIYE